MRYSSAPILALALVLCAAPAPSQMKKPLDPKLARISYSFSLHPSDAPLTFLVQLDASSTITEVQVFHSGATKPFQVLPSCEHNLPMQLLEGDEKLELVQHADFDFDGYEDVELLQYENDHLGKQLFCVYLWDAAPLRFRYEPQLFVADPVPHPETQTITSHSEYFGGEHIDSTFHWEGTKLVLVSESGLIRGPRAECGFVDYSRKLIGGKMCTIDEHYTDCEEKPKPLPRP